jgi:hypothetical protein
MPSQILYNQRPIAVRSISYGGRTLKGATDLSTAGASDGDVVIFDADTNSFKLAPVSSTAASFDAGEF